MAKLRNKNSIKCPVKVNGIEFDALIESSESYSATAPSYPTEQGFSVNDTLVLDQLEVSMTLYVTNTPVTWKSRHTPSTSRVHNICSKLISLYNSKDVITITTSDATYKNMVITSMTISKTLEQGYAREIPITFSQITITDTESASVPSSYAKSGTTQAPTGTASTSSVSSSGSSSGSVAQRNSSSSSSDSTSKKGASILYSVSKATGIIK